MIDGPRFTAGDMKPRDWWLLSDSVPREEACNDLQRAVKWFAWGRGWLGGDGLPSGKSGRKWLRRIRNGLAGGSYQAGPFRMERAGRWGIVFVLDPAYAIQRTARRRRRRSLDSGGLDAAFERDLRRRIDARLSGL